MAGLAMTVSDAKPRMESSLIDAPNDRCPKGRFTVMRRLKFRTQDNNTGLMTSTWTNQHLPVSPLHPNPSIRAPIPQALGLASSPPRLLERSKSQ
ncbi:hypothetical protein G3M48_009192 [Beauveria asiatica]|uniref:Uncharacterized protein n=1 Tax=Beauveria asiatica TaxID=1069075 RepID=A0AAW0S2T6_9HYPO